MKRSIHAFLALAIIASGAPTAEEDPYDIEQVFDVDWSNDAYGACGGAYHKVDIVNSYSEAMQALKKTVNDLEWLQKLEAEPTQGDAHERYLKITETFQPLFGDDARAQNSGLTKTGEAVLGVYQDYVKQHTAGKSPKKEPKYFLRCNDIWLKFLYPTDKDPREKGKSDADEYTLAEPREKLDKFPNGALTTKEQHPKPGLPGGKDLIYVDIKPGENRSPFCDKKTKAVSNKPNNLLILCPNAYMRPPAYLGKSITFKKDVKANDELDSLSEKALPTTWIHEMGHYVNGWPEPEVEKNAVYHWDLTTSLAKTNKVASLQAPEAFALFATAMYYDQWYWGTGKAKLKSGYEHTPPPSSPKPRPAHLVPGSDVYDPFASG